jgi:cytochrome c5
MKKIFVITLALISITVACKSKKTVSSSSSTVSSMDVQLAAVNVRFPNTTMQELKKGQSVYTGACTKCHGTKDVTTYTEPKLLEIVDVMAKKAELTADEKQALIKFAVGVRATSK